MSLVNKFTCLFNLLPTNLEWSSFSLSLISEYGGQFADQQIDIGYGHLQKLTDGLWCLTINQFNDPSSILRPPLLDFLLSDSVIAPLAVMRSLLLLNCPPPICNPWPLNLFNCLLILSLPGPHAMLSETCFFLIPGPTYLKFQNLQIPYILWDSINISLARLALSDMVSSSNIWLLKSQ